MTRQKQEMEMTQETQTTEKTMSLKEAKAQARGEAVRDVRASMRWEAKQGAPLAVLFAGKLSSELYDVVVCTQAKEATFLLPDGARVKIVSEDFSAGVCKLYTACKTAQDAGHVLINVNVEKKRIELIENAIRVIA
jgi:hypothetical protein